MKAAVHKRYGPPEVVQVTETEKPSPKPGEILVRVYATTVNRTDCGFRSAEYFISRFFSGLFRPAQTILGNEFAGIIEAVGSEVSGFHPGDRVFGYDDRHFGAHAEYKVIDGNSTVCKMPGGMSFEEAAPLTEGAHYALCDLRAAKAGPGQHIMVYGATGAIGSAAVQLAKHFGAHVTAVCATADMDLVRKLGPDRIIDYLTEDYTLTDRPYDIILDAVGKSSFGKCKPALAENGIYISTEFGKNCENMFLALLTPLRGGKKVLFPLPVIRSEDVALLKELAESGKFRPLTDRSYPLDQIVEAYRYVETRQKKGNVIITIA